MNTSRAARHSTRWSAAAADGFRPRTPFSRLALNESLMGGSECAAAPRRVHSAALLSRGVNLQLPATVAARFCPLARPLGTGPLGSSAYDACP